MFAKTSETASYASDTASLPCVSERLVPPHPEIAKAGANVEDQDRHGILVGYHVLTSYQHFARQLS
jgi:hypothetical protein